MDNIKISNFEEKCEQANILIDNGMDVEEAFKKCGIISDSDSLSDDDKKAVIALRGINYFIDSIDSKEKFEENKETINKIDSYLKTFKEKYL